MRFYPEAIRSWFGIDKKGVELDYLLTFYNPYSIQFGPYNIAYKMNKARELVLQKRYDWLFNVEHDIVLPENALQKLLNDKKKVVSGLYRGRPSSFFNKAVCGQIYNPEGPQGSDTKYPEKGKDFQFGDIIKLAYICFGCLLVAKEILEKVEFRKEIDVDFSRDLRALDIPFHLDTGVRCIHVDETGERIES